MLVDGSSVLLLTVTELLSVTPRSSALLVEAGSLQLGDL